MASLLFKTVRYPDDFYDFVVEKLQSGAVARLEVCETGRELFQFGATRWSFIVVTWDIWIWSNRYDSNALSPQELKNTVSPY